MLLYVHRSEVAYQGWRKEGARGRGGGRGGGGGRKSEWLDRAPTRKAEEDVDQRQNNYVNAVATSPLRSN